MATNEVCQLCASMNSVLGSMAPFESRLFIFSAMTTTDSKGRQQRSASTNASILELCHIVTCSVDNSSFRTYHLRGRGLLCTISMSVMSACGPTSLACACVPSAVTTSQVLQMLSIAFSAVPCHIYQDNFFCLCMVDNG